MKKYESLPLTFSFTDDPLLPETQRLMKLDFSGRKSVHF